MYVKTRKVVKVNPRITIEFFFFLRNYLEYNQSLGLTVDSGFDVLQSTGVACIEYPIKSLHQLPCRDMAVALTPVGIRSTKATSAGKEVKGIKLQ